MLFKGKPNQRVPELKVSFWMAISKDFAPVVGTSSKRNDSRDSEKHWLRVQKMIPVYWNIWFINIL